MKKVLALVLAVVLAFGMTTVAFADFAKGDYKLDTTDLLKTGYYTDDGKVSGAEMANLTEVEPGKTIYFPIDVSKYDVDTKDWIDSGYTKLSDLNDFRISYSVNDGKNMVKSVKFVSMNGKEGLYKKGLYVAVETNDNFIMEETALDMDIKISARNNSTVDGVENNGNIETNLAATMTYGTDDVSNGFHTVEDGKNVLSFDDDADDVTLCIGTDVEIQGNMKGQKDVLVRMKDSNDALEEKYPDATLRLFDSTKDTFRRDVNVKLPYESAVEKPFIYEVDAKGNLTKVADAKYDDVAGEFNFKTKTLGNYIMSDTELKSKVDGDTDTDAPAEGDKPTDGTQPNPGTGANDFVGLAVALAVVSIAGIAVAKRK